MLKKIGLIALTAVSAFALHNAEININDKDLEVGLKLDMGQFNEMTEPDTVFVGAKFLHGNEDHSDLTKDTIHDFYELNFLMKREINDSGLTLGLGVKANFTENFNTFPLGIEAGYKIPADFAIPLYVNGYLYYAPEVLSMSDAKNFFETNISFDAEVIENGRITIGYRSLNTNYETNNITSNINYNKSAYIGFKFAF